MTLWVIPRGGGRKRLRLIDRSFAPAFYVHGSEAQLRRLAQTLARRAAGRATCAFTERMNIWDGRPLSVLQVSVRHPTQYAALARLARRSDSTLRLYNSDLMLAAMYCWEKNVFPLASVDVEVGDQPGAGGWGLRTRERETLRNAVIPSEARNLALQMNYVRDSSSPAAPWNDRRDGFSRTQLAPAEVLSIECRDDEWAIDYELPPLTIMHTRLEGLARVNPQHGRHGTLEVAIDGEWRVLDDAEEPVVMGFERMLRAHDPDLIVSEWGDS